MISSLFENGKVKIEVPADALFENLEFTYAETPPSNGFLSVNYQIHSPETPLFKPFTLSVVAPDVAPELRDKLIFVTYDPEEEKIASAGGSFKRGEWSLP